MKRLLSLFWELFKISLFVIGGGYAIIAVADGVFARKKWTEEGELVDQLPVFQMLPGLIATHTAVYVGNKRAGWRGALVGVLAVALPAVGVFTFVSVGYQTIPLGNPHLASAFVGLRAALTGIIAATVLRSWQRARKDAFFYALAFSGVCAIGLAGWPVALVLLVAIACGLAAEFTPHVPRYHASLLPFLVFLKYGALGFGGGFVLVPMYLEDFVGADAPHLQIAEEMFTNIMALSQMTPGPIGVNCATFFGYRLAGVAGALLATALLLLPGSLLAFAAFRSLDRFRASRIVRGIMRGVRPASLALMLCALWAFAALSAFAPAADGKPSLNLISLLLTLTTMLLVMKKKMNVICLIMLCALAATALRADDVTCARYPDADTVVVDESERVAYNPDGTYESWSETWTKILTEKGRRESSVTRLDYSRRYGLGEIVYVGAIDANGVERTIDVSATTKETTDNGSTSVNIYDPLDRQIVCTIPGLKIGETLHVKTHRKAERARCVNQWSDISLHEWTKPILRSTYSVTAPRERPLKRIVVRHPIGNLATNCVVHADGRVTHVFTSTNSPQVFPEPSMPALYTQVQNVRVSTAADWPEISRWYWDLCAPHLARTNAALVAKARELKSVRAIFKFVSQEVRYMGLTMEDTSPGYAPHDVDITFDNRYGVCRDKAALLVAMLRAAGHDAYPVLIQVGAKLDPEVPQPFFNHAIVAVDRGNRAYELMDPTDENARDLFPSYLCDKSYLVCRADGERLATSPVPAPDRNAFDVTTHGTLSKEGSLFLESDLAFAGINDTLYRHALVKMKPEDRTKLFERILKAQSPGAELIRCDIEPKDLRDTEAALRVRLALRVPETVLRGERTDELAVPFLSRSFGMMNYLLADNTALVQRKYPLELDTTACVRECMTLNLCGGLGETRFLPDVQVGGESGFRFTRGFAVTNGVLTAHRVQTLSAIAFDPQAYGDLREALKEVEAAEREHPRFARDILGEADVRIILDASETTIRSDRSWVTTNTVVKEVLTYAGKRRSAELSFAYNPSWESVTLLSASVSNRNGSVARVSPREMNVLDCGWAAGAPRYPAGKTLIVNLPSVETGSVLSYSVVRTVTNAPASFYRTYVFDSIEPVERRRVRVNDWCRDETRVRRLPNEPNQPAAALWRDVVTITSNRFERFGLALTSLPFAEAGRTIREIRDWVAKYVKVRGPSLYELPLGEQLTPPAVVLKERYGTYLDVARTLCAILRGAGFEADVVLAAADADASPAERRRMMFERPNVRAFSIPLCRVRERSGGWWGFGGVEKTYFLGGENQYAELGATACDGCDFYDPAEGTFGIVRPAAPELSDRVEETCVYDVREDGAVDLSVENRIYGAGVATFRKTYAEILPEQRFRRYQAILGDIAQAATATGALETDIESYPARRAFSCHVPNFATVCGDVLTLQLPALISSVAQRAGSARQTPFAVAASDRQRETVVVRFPKGYVKIEHLPESFVFADPRDERQVWMTSSVSSEIREGALEVRLTRTLLPHADAWYPASYYELVKDWARIANARANRTISVRR